MEIHESAEDYLETILILEERNHEVRSIDIVNEMGYSKPSISIAMKKLRENGYIQMDNSGYITLLPKGREIAERIYARHKLLRKALLAIGVDESKATNEACHIEHVIDDDTYEKLKVYYEVHMNPKEEREEDALMRDVLISAGVEESKAQIEARRIQNVIDEDTKDKLKALYEQKKKQEKTEENV